MSVNLFHKLTMNSEFVDENRGVTNVVGDDAIQNGQQTNRISSAPTLQSPKMADSNNNSNNNKKLRSGRQSIRLSMRQSIRQSIAKPRMSLKFCAKNFVTKWAGGLEEHYRLGKLLGEGGYGSVYACTHIETGAERAVKVIPKSFDEEQNEMVIREFNVIKELDHPNVVKTYALFETDTHFNIVTDMISGGELYDLLQSEFTEDEVRDLMKAMLSCMNYCHKNNVVHRDLKPENILIEENQNFSRIKVIDFGLSAFFNTEENTTFTRQVGSSYYMSPQVIEGRYTQKCDIWSCGVIAFVCLGGYAPFEGEDEVETAESILDSEHTGVVFDDPVWDDFSDEALDFIQYLMTYNEAERPTAEIALQHPWFQMGKRLSLEDESEIRESARHSIERLQSFHTHDSKLKQCTYSLIASQILRKEQKEEVEEMFRNLDKDCDGKISGDDMRAIYKEHYDTELSDDDLDAIMFEVNLSATGAISYSEFVIASMLEKGLVSEHNLELAFRMIDKEDCGYLCFDNLKGILNVDDSMESYVNKRIIGPADLDQDGKISLKEFKALFAAAESPAKYHIRRRQSLQAAPKNLITGRRQSVRLSDRKSLRVSQILNQSDVAGIVADLTDSNESMLNSEPTFSSLLHIFEKNGSTLSECGISGGSIPNTLQWDNDEEK